VELRRSGDNGGMGKLWILGLGVTLEVKAGYGRGPSVRLNLWDGHGLGKFSGGGEQL
jgi:hypothetical protein